MDRFVSGASAAPSLPPASRASSKAVPWVEKYRPRRVDDIAQQDEVVAVLKQCLGGSDLPNLLFYGPPGTGKTSSALAVARQLFGDIFRDRVLELNASDERGIQIVRQKIKNFSQFAASSSKPDGTPCPALKLIILDEADSMTTAAQAALRRTMERQSHSTRFILICNYVSRIISPLTSRCAKFQFKPLGRDVSVKRLKDICASEKVQASDDVLDRLVTYSDGDLRKAITYMQCLGSVLGDDEAVQEEDVLEITGTIPDVVIEKFLDICSRGIYDEMMSFIERSILNNGYSSNQLLSQLLGAVLSDVRLKDGQRARVLEELAICDKRLIDGASEYIQLLDVGATLITQLRLSADNS